jgi:hypothetical protein
MTSTVPPPRRLWTHLLVVLLQVLDLGSHVLHLLLQVSLGLAGVLHHLVERADLS